MTVATDQIAPIGATATTTAATDPIHATGTSAVCRGKGLGSGGYVPPIIPMA